MPLGYNQVINSCQLRARPIDDKLIFTKQEKNKLNLQLNHNPLQKWLSRVKSNKYYDIQPSL